MTMNDEERAKYLAAGLPLPVYKTTAVDSREPRSTAERLTYDGKVGVIVHRVLANVVDPIRTLALDERVRLVESSVRSLTAGRRDLGRSDKTATRVTGLVGQYLALFLPSAEADFLGAEQSSGTGRTDLAWRLPGYGVWFDELKTWRGVGSVLDQATLEQIYRYVDAGAATYGAHFRGVRILPLGNAHAAAFVTACGDVTDLADSDFGVKDEEGIA